MDLINEIGNVVGRAGVFYDYLEKWVRARIHKHIEYQKAVTLTGNAENIDISLLPCSIQRISVWANDTTSKSFTVNVYNGGVTTTSYDRLATFTVNTDQSIIIELGDQYAYIQSPIVLRIAVTASTADKVLTVKILTERI